MTVWTRYVDIPGWKRLQPALDMECMQPMGVRPADW